MKMKNMWSALFCRFFSTPLVCCFHCQVTVRADTLVSYDLRVINNSWTCPSRSFSIGQQAQGLHFCPLSINICLCAAPVLTNNKCQVTSNHFTTHSLLYFWFICLDSRVTVKLQIAISVIWLKWSTFKTMMAEHSDPPTLLIYYTNVQFLFYL